MTCKGISLAQARIVEIITALVVVPYKAEPKETPDGDYRRTRRA